MLKITSNLSIHESEIEYAFIKSPGPGGQHVNTASTAVQLRFNVKTSPSIDDALRPRLLFALGNKLTNGGEIVIKAHQSRSQQQNKEDALRRLVALLADAATPQKKRKPTRTPWSSKEGRLQDKKIQSQKKQNRQGPDSSNSY